MKYNLSLAVVLMGAALASAAPPPEAQDVVLMADSRAYPVRLHIYVDGRPYGGRYDVYLRRWFAFLDRNGDGVLDKDEARHALSADQMVLQVQNGAFFGTRGGNTPPPAFRDLDTDGNGKVTIAEFLAYYRRAGFGPIMLINGNQFGNGADLAGDVIFRALDTDGDGKLSKAELAKAEEVLRRFDANDDEVITAQELTGNTGIGGRGIQQFGFPQQALTSTGPVLLISPDEKGRLAAAKAILARYDKKGDGVLTRTTFPLPAALFTKLDTDKDGVLSADEIAVWLAKPSDTVIVLRLGKVDPDQAPIEALNGDDEKAEVKVEKMPADVYSLTAGDLRVRVKRSEGMSASDNIRNPRIRQFYLQNFKGSDNGNKGFLTAEDVKEGQAAALFSGIFSRADRDGDGKLTEKELTDFLDLMDGAPAGLTSMVVTEQGTGLFDMLDANGDGRLSIRELRNAAKRLAELDRKGKGFIAKSDLPRHLTIALNPGAPLLGGRGLPVPVVRRDDRADPSRPVPARGPLWFRKMDLNGDGDISPREWLGTPELFKQIDEDGDGLISVEEAERYDRRREREKENKP